tara:strand:+ start:18 stop:248 length:231 start_codon:yes stop_codon:yes gene_type:complete
MKFLGSNGHSNVSAQLFLETYVEIQRVSDEHDRSDSMFLYYKEIVATYLTDRISPELNGVYGSSEDYIKDYDKVWD